MTTDLHHLAAAYALDALDGAERRAFEAHYPSCEICAADVDGYRAVTGSLAAAVAEEPSADLRSRVMNEVAVTRQLSPLSARSSGNDAAFMDRRRRVVASLAAVAAVIAFLVVGNAFLASGSGTDFDDILAAPDAVVTALDGETGSIRVVWSAERDQVAVFANGLADPGAGLLYELWFLLDEGVSPAGLFQPDSDGVVRTVLDVDDLSGTGWGVTIEPEGGSDQPTSAVVYVGVL